MKFTHSRISQSNNLLQKNSFPAILIHPQIEKALPYLFPK